MHKSRTNAAPTLAVLSLLLIGTAAQAQVIRDYDTVYPMGAPFTINERGAVIPGEQPVLLDDDHYLAKVRIHRHEHFRRNDDNVYGKTIELNLGMGGAHFVN